MTHVTSQRPSRYPFISVFGNIRFGQFLELVGLVEDGVQARIAIQSGDVTVNGIMETCRGYHLASRDVVVVDYPADRVGTAVEQPGFGR